MIKCENVSIDYKNRECILEKVNICFAPSEVYVIIGSSGAGKSTLINSVLGFKKPSTGVISYDDVDIYSIADNKRASLKKKFGYVPQSYSLIDSLSVMENVCIASLFSDPLKKFESEHEKTERILETLNIKHLMNVTTKKISGGEKRRVEIARAFIKGEEVIVMDEPTNNLDDMSVEYVKGLINEYMQKPEFYRAIDTKGKNIETPAYIASSQYEFWK
ncbi:ATP-binding cassette domain-containing protein [Ruminococcus flavefaciens]|uniref:ATP-binding cassette domain-containing protein n=1 Tax=Ruminococcus flavefaciens TaxID=1265 RepID=UPI00048ED213|nr:ABC transporter ATP-binding protein [Ruminococcus flavefaciens]